MINSAIAALVRYAEQKRLIAPEDRIWAVNSLLELLKLDVWEEPDAEDASFDLAAVLAELADDALVRGVLTDDSVTGRDLFDTALMGRLTPPPREVISQFFQLYARAPREATDWFYQFSIDVNYIRRDRIVKDVQWKTPTEYGDLDITINLSKPEKDPRAIAAARNATGGYPKCQLCRENEGYAGRMDHPARQNLRMIPVTVAGKSWFLQYSPYVYYNEHCIFLNSEHVPMRIDRACFEKLLDITTQFPHYFVGSNADLPIVGGSILAHDHFQGGRYEFPMARAEVEREVTFRDFPDIAAGIVKWPMSNLRLRGTDPKRLADLADRVLTAWRAYTDPEAGIFAQTDGVAHNTITPIARRRGNDYELDLLLRNNLTTPEHPLGVFHPHAELHHIKKENIGLIEVMGLAVLPARLKTELAAVGGMLCSGGDLTADPLTKTHAAWAADLAARYTITPENVDDILKREVGLVFAQVLEHAGVFKRTDAGQTAFLRFTECV